MMIQKARLALAGLCLLPLSGNGSAETVEIGSSAAISSESSGFVLPDSVSPFGKPALTAEEEAASTMPRLDGKPTAEDEANFDKYYYFHRNDTDVATAYDDISECDGYARGLATSYRYQDAPYPYSYTMAGAVGGAIGNAMVAAIFGSAEKRKARRVNMRACMAFKGYQRFGLPKDLWEKFNFEEGLDSVSTGVRHTLLRQQALVASNSTPTGKVLEP